MTWQGKRRKQLPKNWASLRKQRLELDGYRCTHIEWVDFDGQPSKLPLQLRICPARATEVDHLNLNPDDHRLESLRSLCGYHLEEKARAS